MEEYRRGEHTETALEIDNFPDQHREESSTIDKAEEVQLRKK